MTSAIPAEVAAAIKALVAFAGLEEDNPWRKYPAVLQVKHVAQILGVGEEAVRSQCRRGRPGCVPMVMCGGKYVIDQVEFRRWVGYGAASRRAGAAT